MIILDTDVLSHIQKRDSVGVLVDSKLDFSVDREIWITSVNAYEMLSGAVAWIERQKKERRDLIHPYFLF